MTWEDLIIIALAIIFRITIDYIDAIPNYSCPEYCQVDHAHFPERLARGTEYLKEEDINATKDR